MPSDRAEEGRATASHRCEARKKMLTKSPSVSILRASLGAIAQLGERYNGIVEVGGSIPPGSTKVLYASPSSRGLGHRPFTAATGVRIPLGTPRVRG